jgi:hypothetical protein
MAGSGARGATLARADHAGPYPAIGTDRRARGTVPDFPQSEPRHLPIPLVRVKI